jgi:hypothetical protein
VSEFRDKEELFKENEAQKNKLGKNPIVISESAKMANMEDEKTPLISGNTLLQGGSLVMKGKETFESIRGLQSAYSRGWGDDKAYAEGGRADRSDAEVELERLSAQSSTVAGGIDVAKTGVQKGIEKIVVPQIMKGSKDVTSAVKGANVAKGLGKAVGVAGTVASAASLGSQIADLKHEGKQEGFVGENEKTAQKLDVAGTAVGVAGGVAGLAGAGGVAGGVGAGVAAGATALAGGAGIGSAALAAGAALGPVGWAALGLGAAAMAFKKKGGSTRLR